MADGEEGLKKAIGELLALEGIVLEEKKGEEEPFESLVGRTEQVLEELNQKAEMMAQQLRMSKEEIEDYAANPNNFTNAQWEALQKVKKEAEVLRSKTRSTIGEEFLKEAIEKERKKGARRFGKKKKGWLQI